MMTPEEQTAAEIVCLVDDDPAVLKSIGRLLASDGFKARAFSEPKQFLDHVRVHSVPVVILDIWMEEMTGLEVQPHLRALSPETKIIIITGNQDKAAEQTAMHAGAFAFFNKPFDGSEFLATVRSALGK